VLNRFFYQQCQLQLRQGSQQLLALAFFSFMIFLWPVITTVKGDQLTHLAPGIIWLTAMFAQCLNLNLLFEDDYQQGLLEVYCLSPQSTSLLILIRQLAYNLTHLLPILIFSVFAAALYRLDATTSLMLLLSLSLGLPTLALLGAVLSALLLNSRQGSLMLLVLVFPLYIPVVILATSLVSASQQGYPTLSYLCLLTAINCVAHAVFPSLIAFGISISLETD
jgi:heme exporter protein B